MSRTDSIGDVVLTLPMAGVLKKHFPTCEVVFLGRSYTKDVIVLSKHVDQFVNYDELEKLPLAGAATEIKKLNADIFLHVFPKKEIAQLAKKAGIGLRVGTTNRLYHWLYCNKLVRLSRKNSPLHEAQLNIKLLRFMAIDADIQLADIKNYYGFENVPALDSKAASWIDSKRVNLILHPKSKGSAKEWGLDNFKKLVELLPEEKYKIFVSGTAQDAQLMPELLSHPKIHDLTGKLSLQQFIAFINKSDGLIAASTGPLHIAAALNKKALGLFSPRRPIHPGRWAPLGEKAGFLVFDADCKKCRESRDCNCIQDIDPQDVIRKLMEL